MSIIYNYSRLVKIKTWKYLKYNFKKYGYELNNSYIDTLRLSKAVFPELKKYKLGDIYNGVTNTAIQDEFAQCNVYARPDCHDCWAKLYCSGGCAANAYHSTGSVKGVYKYGCDLFKKRMECAIMVAVDRAFRE